MRKLLTVFTAMMVMAAPVYAGHGAEGEAPHEATQSEQGDAFASDIDVNVNGLVCDFCARALEKVFGKRAEVNGIHVDLSNHLVAIDFKDGADMSDEEITQLITDAGYAVVEINRL